MAIISKLLIFIQNMQDGSVSKKRVVFFHPSFITLDQQMNFFIHRVHVNLEREAYREKEGKRFSEFTWNL